MKYNLYAAIHYIFLLTIYEETYVITNKTDNVETYKHIR